MSSFRKTKFDFSLKFELQVIGNSGNELLVFTSGDYNGISKAI